MKIQKITSLVLSATAFSIISACGGGGGGSSPAPLPSYKVTPAPSGVNGSITPNTAQSVTQGSPASFTITPAAGYGIATVTGCGGTLNGNIYTTAAVSSDCTVTATFNANSYSVSSTVVTAPATGTINCLPSSVLSANSSTCAITPATGYQLSALTANGVDVKGDMVGSSYTINNITADQTVSASFAIKTFTVTPSAGQNGTLSPSTAQSAAYNSTPSFTVTPASGYEISSVSGCGGTLSGNTYTTGPISGNCSISASFSPTQFNITSRVATGSGTINCLTPVNSGNTSVCTLTSGTGYYLSSLLDNASNVTAAISGNSYSIAGVSANHDVVADFVLKQYTVTPTPPINGSISPGTPQTVTHGATTSFIVTPDAGSSLASIIGCGGALSGTTYTTGAVQGNCTVAVSFSINQYNITSRVAGGTGSISCQSPIQYGGNAACTITPGTGYKLLNLTDNNTNKTSSVSGGSYTIANVTNNHDVAATFTPIQYTVTASAGANGFITPGGGTAVNHGDTINYTVTPISGYRISAVSGCNGTLTGSTYTTAAITAACAVNASFTPVQYTVTPSAGANGTITPNSPQVVNQGSTTSFSITPAVGYSISTASGCGGTLSGSTYTTAPINNNCTVSTTFSSTQYSVTPAAGANGTITPGTPQLITHGNNASFTITPANGYRISTVSGCGGTLAGSTFTTGPITGACNVNASFIANTTASLTFSVTNLNAGISIGALQYLFTLPGGVTPAGLADTDNPAVKDASSAFTLKSGVSAFFAASYQPASGLVEIGFLSATGLDPLNFVTLNCAIAPGLPTPQLPAQATVVSASDINGNIINGLGVQISSSIAKQVLRKTK